MSSTYRILCLSHDPAITISADYNSFDDAEENIRDGYTGHENCDLMIGRYSYPLVEVGCPRSADRPDHLRPDVLRCYHGSTQWTDKDWLLLLSAAYQSEDPAIREAIKAGHHNCLPWERLRRLRLELDITVTAPALGAGVAAAETGAVCAAYRPPATSDGSGLCARCGMFDYKHSEQANA